MIRYGKTFIMNEELAYDRPLKESDRRGRVRFPDGKLRAVLLGVADTWFTIPARAKVCGRTRHGFVYRDSDSEEFRFCDMTAKREQNK